MDKYHRVGPVHDEDGTQSTIVRLKSHSMKETIYKNRTKNKNKKIKI